MKDQARRTRCERLLALRLEEVSRVLESRRPDGPEAERLVWLASAATRRAVSLRLLSAADAEAIWADASVRHPAFGDAARRAGAEPAA